MYWKKGTSRVVLVIPALGICLKFARVRVREAVRTTFRDLVRQRVGTAWRFWGYPVGSSVGGRRLLFRGMLDNWREWRYSLRRKSHPALARTYVSFGVVSVQELVVANPLPIDSHYRRLEDVVGWRVLNDVGDPHAFSQKNFGLRGGKAVVADYASLAMQTVLDGYADQIHNELDLVSPP